MAAYHSYTPAQVAKGNAILGQKDKAIGEIYEDFTAFVKDDLGEGVEEVAPATRASFPPTPRASRFCAPN